MIILAHVNAPDALFLFRCFDVPLMVFVSGLTCSGKHIDSYWKYIWKRTKRLIVPTYLFLTAYFVITFVLSLVFSKYEPFSLRQVAESYLLVNGIGYIWIIRVFLLIMLVTPLLLLIEKKISNDKLLIISIIVGVALTTIAAKYSVAMENPYLRTICSNWIVYLMGYSLMFILGLRMKHIDAKRERSIALWIAVVAAALVGFHFWRNGFTMIRVQSYKYPPQSYYLMYGLLMCSILWCLRKVLVKVLNNRYFLFIGRNTIWIYLYHIFFLYLTSTLPIHWLAKYVIVYTLAVAVTYLQYRIAGKYDLQQILDRIVFLLKTRVTSPPVRT